MKNEVYKILIADDSRLSQEALCQILRQKYSDDAETEQSDHTFILARTGYEALEKVASELPDLILLDIIMPGMDGFAVLAELKKSDLTRSIPVIIITGMSRAEDEVKGFLLGAVDYITKPFHEAVVKARIETHLRIVSQMRIIERCSFVDTLTNLPNRRQFDNNMIAEWNRAVREKIPISVLMVDVDHFKIFNDTHGHQLGDLALQVVAKEILSSLKRSSDVAARWGGEEFSVLLPNTTLEGAMKVAEDIRKNVEAAVIQMPCGASQLQVTVSAGVASFIPGNDSDISEIIRRADEALYIAKDSGRNKVCSFDSP